VLVKELLAIHASKVKLFKSGKISRKMKRRDRLKEGRHGASWTFVPSEKQGWGESLLSIHPNHERQSRDAAVLFVPILSDAIAAAICNALLLTSLLVACMPARRGGIRRAATVHTVE
jgi:hypothetical protein